MTVARFLDLSTAYLTVEDRGHLHVVDFDGENLADLKVPGLIVRPHPHGWFIHVPLDKEEYRALIKAMKPKFSPGFIECMLFAHDRQCWWINFDASGSDEPSLTRFEEDHNIQTEEELAQLIADTAKQPTMVAADLDKFPPKPQNAEMVRVPTPPL